MKSLCSTPSATRLSTVTFETVSVLVWFTVTLLHLSTVDRKTLSYLRLSPPGDRWDGVFDFALRDSVRVRFLNIPSLSRCKLLAIVASSLPRNCLPVVDSDIHYRLRYVQDKKIHRNLQMEMEYRLALCLVPCILSAIFEYHRASIRHDCVSVRVYNFMWSCEYEIQIKRNELSAWIQTQMYIWLFVDSK